MEPDIAAAQFLAVAIRESGMGWPRKCTLREVEIKYSNIVRRCINVISRRQRRWPARLVGSVVFLASLLSTL